MSYLCSGGQLFGDGSVRVSVFRQRDQGKGSASSSGHIDYNTLEEKQCLIDGVSPTTWDFGDFNLSIRQARAASVLEHNVFGAIKRTHVLLTTCLWKQLVELTLTPWTKGPLRDVGYTGPQVGSLAAVPVHAHHPEHRRGCE